MLVMEIIFIGLGLIFLILGWNNWNGDISSIHSYHKNRIQPQNIRAYGRWMGAAAMLMGVGSLLSAFLVFFFGEELLITFIPFLIVGVGMMIYAQYRFNKGIF